MVEIILAAVALFSIGLPLWVEIIIFGIMWIGLPVISDIAVIATWAVACFRMIMAPVTAFTYIFWLVFIVAVILQIRKVYLALKK